MQKKQNGISPTRKEDYAEWYLEVVKAADLAEHSPVRGCMVIKPWGYGIWENMQRILNEYFKKRGVQNAYFPLFIPLSFMQKEAEHVEGFAKECAIVTHYRLEKNDKGELVPAKDAALQEPLIVRPTSETIIGEMFSKWVQSYRDLPLKINQWANIVRWEMRTRLFLRTTEFLWQEGHTVHATSEEAQKDVLDMLDVYANFCENYLAIPVIKGKKTEAEKFPGGVDTYSIEAMMQDKKALQAGTSHFLGQNFAKSSNIKFRDNNLNEQYGWTTSWGVATRLIGALVMIHSDDDGLILPPKIATCHVVILPIIHKEDGGILKYCHALKEELQKCLFNGRDVEVVVDDRDMRGGEKKWQWVKKGVPLRIEVGMKEMQESMLTIFARDTDGFVKIKKEDLLQKIALLLNDMQERMLKKAKQFLADNILEVHSKEEFYANIAKEDAGFILCYFHEDAALEEKIKNEFNATIRCIPLEQKQDKGKCIFSNKPTDKQVIFARAY
jgi:prolyl-tRNA synthetase